MQLDLFIPPPVPRPPIKLEVAKPRPTRKRFSKKDFLKHDRETRDAFLKRFSGRFDKIRENDPLLTDPRLLSRLPDFTVRTTDKQQFHIEVEHRAYWDKQWKFEKGDEKVFSLPKRDIKYLSLGLPTLFIVFNADYSNYYSIWGSDTNPAKQIKISNTHADNETFVEIEPSKVRLNEI